MVFLVHFLLKSWLKTQHSKTNIMASSSITWWQIDGKKCKQRFYFLGLQNHCRWWLQTQKDNWLLGIKTMTNLGSILKSRGITLSTKVCIVIAMVFPLVIYGCESWTIKKAEHQRIDAFEMWCWRRLLRVLWTAGISDQSILKEINPEHSLEGLMLKLRYFGHLMQRAN